MSTKIPPAKVRYGDYIQQARAKLGWTQTQLGEHFGRTKANISAWEKDRHEPSPQQLQELANLSGIPLPGQDRVAMQTLPKYGAGESSEVQRLIVAFGWLTDDQQKTILSDLETKAETNKAISRELGARWEFKSDRDVARHIAPAPHNHPHITRKKKDGGPSRNIGDVLGDFQNDD